MGDAPDEDRGTCCCCWWWLMAPALAVGVETTLLGPLLKLASCDRKCAYVLSTSGSSGASSTALEYSREAPSMSPLAWGEERERRRVVNCFSAENGKTL